MFFFLISKTVKLWVVNRQCRILKLKFSVYFCHFVEQKGFIHGSWLWIELDWTAWVDKFLVSYLE